MWDDAHATGVGGRDSHRKVGMHVGVLMRMWTELGDVGHAIIELLVNKGSMDKAGANAISSVCLFVCLSVSH